MDFLENMKKEMLRRNYSLRTIQTYNYCINKFFRINHKDIRKITKYDVMDYLRRLSGKNLSGNTINVNLQALKFFMEEV